MAKNTRTALYHNAANISDKFRNHLLVIWSFTDQQRKTILYHLPSILASITQREDMLLCENAANAIGGDPQKAMQAIAVVKAIAGIWDPTTDTASLAMKDIEVLHVLPDDIKQRKDALRFLRNLFDVLERDSARRLRKRAKEALLPSLMNCETVIDERRIIKNAFDWKNESLDTYKPTVVGSVPVAIIRLKLTDGDPVIFQGDAEDLEMLIRKLKATIKDMK